MYLDLSRTNLFWISIRKIFQSFLILLFLFFVGRTIFTFYFIPKELITGNILDVFYAYYLGVRYDAIVISYFILPLYLIFLLLSLLKARNFINLIYKFSFVYIFVVALFIIAMIVCDLGYYSFFQDHLNILFFGLLEDDTEAVFISIWKNYPVIWLSIPIIGFFIFIWKVFKNIFKKIDNCERDTFNAGPVQFIILFFVSFVILIGALRGGYSWYVLSPKYNEFSQYQIINHIALNGIITFEKAIKLRSTRNRKNFKMYKSMGYKNIDEALIDYLGQDVQFNNDQERVRALFKRTAKSEVIEKNPPHVIMILAESFGAYWMDYNNPEFNFLGSLQKHFEEDYYFNNFLSSHNGTIGSLITLQSSIPDIPGQRYLSESTYMATPLESSVNIAYSKKGYETTFIYGGKLGWRDIGSYFKHQKYDNIIGENNIKSELKLEGGVGTEWGMYDEFIYKYIQMRISTATKPQFIFILTTSNHPPYQYPDTYAGVEFKIPESLDKRVERERNLFNQRFSTFRYANDKIGDFLSWLKESELKNNTVVALTGDHNFFSFLTYKDDEKFKKYKVPFYLYLPEELKPDDELYDSTKLGSHEDIFATLYPLTISDGEYLNFGENLFTQEDTFAINSKGYAHHDGLIIENLNHKWIENQKIARNDEVDLKHVEKYKKSLLSVLDFYLKYQYKIPYKPTW